MLRFDHGLLAASMEPYNGPFINEFEMVTITIACRQFNASAENLKLEIQEILELQLKDC